MKKNKPSWDSESIAQIRAEKEKFRDSQDLKNLQEMLKSSTLSANQFPLEFIQNAEDEGAEDIFFVLGEDYLIIYNNGDPFRIEDDRNDPEGFCSIGSSQKFEKGIGFLGIGAKSIFIITKKPWITSGKFNFSVEEMLYPNIENNIPEAITSFIKDNNLDISDGAYFYIPLSPNEEGVLNHDNIKDILDSLDPKVMMFLTYLEKIHIIDNAPFNSRILVREPLKDFNRDDSKNIESHQEIDRDSQNFSQISLFEIVDYEDRDDIEKPQWVIGEMKCPTSDGAKNSLPLTPMYQKKRSSQSTKVSVAIPIASNENTYPLYCYLPIIDAKTNLPIILQADFVTITSRNDLKDKEIGITWNDELLSYLGVLSAYTTQLCHNSTDLNIDLIDIIPNERDIPEYLDPFITQYKETLMTLDFEIEEERIMLNSVLLCPDDTRFLSDYNLGYIGMDKRSRIYIEDTNTIIPILEWIGVSRLMGDDIYSILQKYSKESRHNPVCIYNCYYSIVKFYENGDLSDDTLNDMRSEKWLYDNKNKFIQPHDELYFRMRGARTQLHYLDRVLNVEFLHPIFTAFNKAYKYGADNSKRAIISDFLTTEFKVKKLDDEGHFIKNLIISKLESSDVNIADRIQFFSALIFYHDKLKSKLMRDSRKTSDKEYGKLKMRTLCKNILLPSTSFVHGKQITSGLSKILYLYMPSIAKKKSEAQQIFGKTEDVHFLKKRFYSNLKKNLGCSDSYLIDKLHEINIRMDIKVIISTKKNDNVPDFINRNLMSQKYVDYYILGLLEINMEKLSQDIDAIHFLLRQINKKYNNNSKIFKAIYSSSRIYEDHYDSTLKKTLRKIYFYDNKGNKHKLVDCVFGEKFCQLLPSKNEILPFDTSGMRSMLRSLGLEWEISKDDLLHEIKEMEKAYPTSMSTNVIQRLVKIYLELSRKEDTYPRIYYHSNHLKNKWHNSIEAIWSDPTNHLSKYFSIVGDLYSSFDVSYDDIKPFGVKKEPDHEHVFKALSFLRGHINKRKSGVNKSEVVELREFYSYLSNGKIPLGFEDRKILLTESNQMTNGSELYLSKNYELHCELSKRYPDKFICSSISYELSDEFIEYFKVNVIDNQIKQDKISTQEKNEVLSEFLNRLLLMACTYADLHDVSTDGLHDLISDLSVYNVRKINIDFETDDYHLDETIRLLMLNNKLFIATIQDEARKFFEIKESLIKTIFRGYPKEIHRFVGTIMGSFDEKKLWSLFNEQGYTIDQINQFIDKMKLEKEVKELKSTIVPQNEPKPPPVSSPPLKPASPQPQAPPKPKVAIPQVKTPVYANPDDYQIVVGNKKKPKTGKGKEIGVKKRKSSTGHGGGGGGRTHVSNIDTEDLGIRFVTNVCIELFQVEKSDIEDVHKQTKHCDLIVHHAEGDKYIELKASTSNPTAGLTWDEYEEAVKRVDDYYLFLVGNIDENRGTLYIKYIQNPAAYNYIKSGTAQLRDVDDKSWVIIDVNK